jgi:uracil-DNA glycosylase family 4
MGAGDGAMKSGVMFVAEALGKEEATQLKALVGGAGFLLGRALSRKGYSRDDFNYQNILRCKPPYAYIREKSGAYYPWVVQAMDHCEPYLDDQIARVKPRAIVALGETAFERLTGQSLAMNAARGYAFRDRKNRVWVIPTHHPSHIQKGNQPLALTLMLDIEKAIRVAKTPDFSLETPNILQDPPLSRWEEWLAYAMQRVMEGAPLAADIETPYKAGVGAEDELDLEEAGGNQIDRVSFAVDGDTAISVLWQMPYLIGIRKLITLAAERGLMLFWNRAFDRPEIMKNLQMEIPMAHTRDSMDAFHVLFNALPRRLGFATSCLPSSWRLGAWKHLSNSEPAFYNGVDSLALWRNDYDIQRLLAQTGQLDIYNTVCRDIDPVLSFMTGKGMLVDQPAREGLKALIDQEMTKLRLRMNDLVPENVRPRAEWKTLKAAEKGLTLLKEKEEVAPDAALFTFPGKVKESTCSICGEHPITKTHITRKTLLTREKSGEEGVVKL